MTRREWLTKYPPPKTAGALLSLLAELQAKNPRSSEDSTRIIALQAEIDATQHCPTHKQPLVRHAYRPEDLFTCPVGPHFFIWTKNGSAPALLPCDLSKPLPGIDDKLDW